MNRIEERYINLNVIVKLEDFNEDDQEALVSIITDSLKECSVYIGFGSAIVTKAEVDTDKGLERR